MFASSSFVIFSAREARAFHCLSRKEIGSLISSLISSVKRHSSSESDEGKREERGREKSHPIKRLSESTEAEILETHFRQSGI